MSFLNDLLKQKRKLRETSTTITTADGRTLLERKAGMEVIESKSSPLKYGFVVDTKPDDIPVLIIDHLYIGSQDCASSNVLKAYEISNVLSLGVEVSVDVNYKYVPCLDLPETDINPVLNECVPFIKQALEHGQNILVHCNAGVSRASMAVIGFLMREGYLYNEAYKLVKEKRPAIQPNTGFVKQLKLLQCGV